MEKVYGVKRYFFYAPPAAGKPDVKDRLKLEDAIHKPYVCKSMEEFLQVQDNRRIPIALLGTTDEDIRKDKFFTNGFSYISLKPDRLIPFFQQMREEHRVMACFVYENSPVHIFFDLDWDCEKHGPFAVEFQTVQDKQKIQTSFMAVFNQAFKETFGRFPRLSPETLHWVDGCRGQKLSFHVHMLNEAFQTPKDFENWIKLMFVPFLVRKAKEGDVDAQRLGSMDTQTKKWTSFVDSSTAGKNHLLRMAYNRKPGKPPLKWIPNAGPYFDQLVQTEPSVDELLFRSLVSYAISCSPPFLTFSSSKSKGLKNLNLKMEGVFAQSPVAMEISKETKRSTENVETWSWMKDIEIPWYRRNKYPHPVAVANGSGMGMLSASSQAGLFSCDMPFVRYSGKETICPHCTEHSKGAVIHQSNNSYLYLDRKNNQFIFKSQDADCRNFPYKFPVPYEIAIQLNDPELEAVYGPLDWSPMEVVDLPSAPVSLTEYKQNLRKRKFGDSAIGDSATALSPNPTISGPADFENSGAEMEVQGHFTNKMEQTSNWLMALSNKQKQLSTCQTQFEMLQPTKPFKRQKSCVAQL